MNNITDILYLIRKHRFQKKHFELYSENELTQAWTILNDIFIDPSLLVYIIRKFHPVFGSKLIDLTNTAISRIFKYYEGRDKTIFKYIFDNLPDKNVLIEDHETFLHMTVKTEKDVLLQYILRNKSLNANKPNSFDETTLSTAVRYNNLDHVRILLLSGKIDPYEQNHFFWMKDYPESFEMFISQYPNVQINYPDNYLSYTKTRFTKLIKKTRNPSYVFKLQTKHKMFSKSAHYMALITLQADGYFKFKAKNDLRTNYRKTQRFFSIVSKFPLDLMYCMANILDGINDIAIKSQWIRIASYCVLNDGKW
jgi:hypothetical protein